MFNDDNDNDEDTGPVERYIAGPLRRAVHSTRETLFGQRRPGDRTAAYRAGRSAALVRAQLAERIANVSNPLQSVGSEFMEGVRQADARRFATQHLNEQETEEKCRIAKDTVSNCNTRNDQYTRRLLLLLEEGLQSYARTRSIEDPLAQPFYVYNANNLPQTNIGKLYLMQQLRNNIRKMRNQNERRQDNDFDDTIAIDLGDAEIDVGHMRGEIANANMLRAQNSLREERDRFNSAEFRDIRDIPTRVPIYNDALINSQANLVNYDQGVVRWEDNRPVQVQFQFPKKSSKKSSKKSPKKSPKKSSKKSPKKSSKKSPKKSPKKSSKKSPKCLTGKQLSSLLNGLRV